MAIYDTKPTADMRSTVSDGNRHHVTAVLNRAHQLAYLYVDGQLVGTGSVPVTGSIQASTTILTIGRTMSSTAFRFSGSIDDVRIYNRALLPIEATQLYTTTNTYATGECMDNSGWIHPAATEVCDGVDNDCDGLIDEGVVHTYRKDADSDGRSNGSRATGCSAPLGYGLAVSPFASGLNGTGLSAGLVAWYTFDDNTSTDKSGKGKTGNNNGSITYVPGKFGLAASFNTTGDNISIGGGVSHPYAFTKALWIKPTDLTMCVSSRCSLVSNYFEIAGTNSLQFYNYQMSPQGWHSTANNVVVTGQWQHVAVTYDGKILRMYHNGQIKKEVLALAT